MTVVTIDSLTQEASAIQPPQETPIVLGFFPRKRGEWVNLLEKEGSEVKLGEFTAEFSLSKPYLAHRISIVGAEELKVSRFKMEILDLNGSWVKLDGTLDGDNQNVVHYDFSSFIVKIRITCHHGKNFEYFSKVHLKSINLRGWTKDDLESLEKTCYTYFSIEERIEELAKQEKDKIASAAASLAKREAAVVTQETALAEKQAASVQAQEALETKNKEVAATLKDAEENLKVKAQEKDKLELVLAGLVEKKTQTSREVLDLETKASEKMHELQITLESISVKKSELQALNKDVSLFADDIKGFAQQGTAQIKFFSRYILLPAVVVVGIMAWWSIKLTDQAYQDFTTGLGFEVWELLSFKLFSFLFVAAVLSFIYKFCRPFILQIIDINKKRLRLSEIAILAQDVTDSATDGLDISDDEKLDIRLASRMTLIREYMSGKFDSPVGDSGQQVVADAMAKFLKESVTPQTPMPPKSAKAEQQQKSLQ